MKSFLTSLALITTLILASVALAAPAPTPILIGDQQTSTPTTTSGSTVNTGSNNTYVPPPADSDSQTTTTNVPSGAFPGGSVPGTTGSGPLPTGAINGTPAAGTPVATSPQAGSAQLSQCSAIKFLSLLDILIWLKCIIVIAIIPLIFAAAFMFFLWGVMKFIMASDSAKKEEGKKFIMAGMIGLFVMTSIWGIIKILGTTLGIESTVPLLQTHYLTK